MTICVGVGLLVMIDIPDILRSVFTVTVESDDGSYILKILASEVRYEAIHPGAS